jgi:putative CocE/NonD family hydrolase
VGADAAPARFRYDPADPTPTVGGAIMAPDAGARDNRPVEQRPDVLVFSSEPLDQPVEIIGEVAAELSVTRDNPHADLFVRLCDVGPRGRSVNVCDGIVRLTARHPLTGPVKVSLIGAAYRFGRGHRLRLQVSGGAFPRFARNPGNGEVDPPPADLVPTQYEIGLGAREAGHASVLLLPVDREA